jgi:transcriptional regulator with XRE-family HTH domain
MEEQDLSDLIVAELEARGWEKKELAIKARLDPGVITRLIQRKTIPKPETIKKIALAFHIPAEVVFRAAGLLPSRPSKDGDFERWEHILSQLPHEDREWLLQIAYLRLEQQEKKAGMKGSARESS